MRVDESIRKDLGKMKKQERQLSALERRKLDIVFYTELLEEPLPQKFDGDVFKFGEKSRWKKFLNDKIAKAVNEVEKLKERV